MKASLASLALAGLASAAGPAPRPNILWLTAEDICPTLGCYGDAYAVTPNLDRFASGAVRYTQCFGITGVCAPNRSCLITGVYPTRLGSQGMRSRTRLPPEVVCFPELLRRAGYYCANNAKTDYNFPVPPEAWDDCSRTGHWKHRKPGQPFFAVFNHEVSHEGQIRVPDAQRARNTARLTPGQRHDPAKAPVPPYHPDTPEVRLDWARYYDNVTAMDLQVGDRLRELEADGLTEDTIVFFFGDNGTGLPGIKKWVWGDSLQVPLLIRFPKKWSPLAPSGPGTATDRLVSFVDFAPTVLRLAGVEIPAAMQGSAFLGAKAAPARDCVFALRDRMAERFDCVRVARDARYQYLRNFQPHRTWSQFVSYTEAMPTMQVWRKLAEAGRLSGPPARYFDPTKPVEELYDCAADPRQVRNLAGDPAHRDALERLRARCERWMIETGDLGLLPESEMEARSAGSTPYAIAADAAKNPLRELLDAARAANAGEPASLPRLKELLAHRDPALRWWGATGFVTLGPKAAPAAEALTAALADASAEVRVAAAEALIGLGRTDEAMPALRASLGDTSALVRLAALNVADRLGEAARPLLPAIRAAAPGGGDPPAEYCGRLREQILARLGPPGSAGPNP